MRRGRRALAAPVLAAGLAIAGCESRPTPQAAEAASSREWRGGVVDVAWLQDRIGSPRLVVLDARSPHAYVAGHIPSAVSVPRCRTERAGADGISNLVSVPEIEALFGMASVTQDKSVVVYDDGGLRDAARLFWVLEVHGHARVAVLSGGTAAWKQQGLRLSQDVPAPDHGVFVANLQPRRLATKLQVMRASLGLDGAVILDARSMAEYRGEQSETARAGHIPSARNVDATRNLRSPDQAVCLVDDLQALKALYADLPADRRIVTYCNSGARAALSYLALRVLGRDVAVYDGSWQEWSADAALPVETGPP